MHIQIITFNLDGITASEYADMALELSPIFADFPGLISKHWLADDDTNTYGGVYLWESKDAFNTYLASELFAGVGGNPNLINATSKDYSVLEAPTKVTRGL
jgi:heme-degrading monooxygenase HmoA